jgi:hypothetical protein
MRVVTCLYIVTRDAGQKKQTPLSSAAGTESSVTLNAGIECEAYHSRTWILQDVTAANGWTWTLLSCEPDVRVRAERSVA